MAIEHTHSITHPVTHCRSVQWFQEIHIIGNRSLHAVCAKLSDNKLLTTLVICTHHKTFSTRPPLALLQFLIADHHKLCLGFLQTKLHLNIHKINNKSIDEFEAKYNEIKKIYYMHFQRKEHQFVVIQSIWFTNSSKDLRNLTYWSADDDCNWQYRSRFLPWILQSHSFDFSTNKWLLVWSYSIQSSFSARTP